MLLSPKLFAIRALEGLEVVGAEVGILWDIRMGVTRVIREEPVAQAVKAMHSSKAKSLRLAEWAEHDRLLYYRGRIYVPRTSDLCCHIVLLCHDMHVAGHAR